MSTIKEQVARHTYARRTADHNAATQNDFSSGTPPARRLPSPIPARAAATREQWLASPHLVGTQGGMHPEDQLYQSAQHQWVSPRASWEDDDEEEIDDCSPARPGTSARRYGLIPSPNRALPPPTPQNIPTTGHRRRAPRRRIHWMVWLGLMMSIIVSGWMLLSSATAWVQHTVDTWRYGDPRTFQVDVVVGHQDGPSHKSHFIALNLDGHIEVIELPGGDASKSHIYLGPVLTGEGRAEVVVTLTFQDVNGDGRPDMIILFKDLQVVFLNTGTGFQPLNPNGK
jgi:hypothetical protein